MNEFYTKLNYTIPSYDWQNSIVDVDVEYFHHPKLMYFNISKESSDLIISCLPNKIFNQGHYEIKLFTIEGKGILSPHIDYDIKCSMNYYFEPTGSITCWYDLKSGAVLNRFDQERYFRYNNSDLDFACLFKAEKNDVYLLNNSKVHSVVHSSDLIRKMIQIQWYETDYSNIQQLLLNDFGTN